MAENVVTDRQTHTYEPSTVTLAAHARRGLITTMTVIKNINGHEQLIWSRVLDYVIYIQLYQDENVY